MLNKWLCEREFENRAGNQVGIGAKVNPHAAVAYLKNDVAVQKSNRKTN